MCLKFKTALKIDQKKNSNSYASSQQLFVNRAVHISHVMIIDNNEQGNGGYYDQNGSNRMIN